MFGDSACDGKASDLCIVSSGMYHPRFPINQRIARSTVGNDLRHAAVQFSNCQHSQVETKQWEAKKLSSWELDSESKIDPSFLRATQSRSCEFQNSGSWVDYPNDNKTFQRFNQGEGVPSNLNGAPMNQGSLCHTGNIEENSRHRFCALHQERCADHDCLSQWQKQTLNLDEENPGDVSDTFNSGSLPPTDFIHGPYSDLQPGVSLLSLCSKSGPQEQSYSSDATSKAFRKSTATNQFEVSQHKKKFPWMKNTKSHHFEWKEQWQRGEKMFITRIFWKEI